MYYRVEFWACIDGVRVTKRSVCNEFSLAMDKAGVFAPRLNYEENEYFFVFTEKGWAAVKEDFEEKVYYDNLLLQKRFPNYARELVVAVHFEVDTAWAAYADDLQVAFKVA